MAKQSKKLTKFYRAYRNWLEDGAPHKAIFDRECGLCTNLLWFSDDQKWTSKVADNIFEEMRSQFIEAGLSTCFPFNYGDDSYHSHYNIETYHCKAHKNKKRIKWVYDHCMPMHQ